MSEADSQREEEAQRVPEMVNRLEEASREAGNLRVLLQKEQERASALDAQLAQTSTQLDDEQAGKEVGRACQEMGALKPHVSPPTGTTAGAGDLKDSSRS